MNRPIRFLIPLFLVLAAAQIGRLQSEGFNANFQQLETVDKSASASRIDKIAQGDSLSYRNATWGNRVPGLQPDGAFRTLKFSHETVVSQ